MLLAHISILNKELSQLFAGIYHIDVDIICLVGLIAWQFIFKIESSIFILFEHLNYIVSNRHYNFKFVVAEPVFGFCDPVNQLNESDAFVTSVLFNEFIHW